ncbi:MAG: alpha/beta hydrolase fold domain-containing protein [Acidobacteria bacterium]|nr:alpha/beta hydrolase fold domain-containing protein [Acidobacteriota bacterium]
MQAVLDMHAKLGAKPLETLCPQVARQGPGTGPFPLLFYIHGGGWVIADLDTYDASARALTNAAAAVVVSTDYRQPTIPIVG